MKKLAAYGLILIGILIVCYPKASEWYETRQEEKLLAEWEENLMNEEAEQEALEQYDGLTSLFAEETGAGSEETAEPEAVPSADPTASPSPTKAPAKLNAIATIKIPSIDLKLPVLEGATEKNMKVAAVHLKETTKLGEVGNAAIAAHRMRIKGRLFNRLDEVQVGDKITVETKDDTFVYKVYKISVVEPTDVSVLNYNNTDRRLTLITCDPLVNPTHRLIVHAEME